jgi:NAD(P)-dependent dehydrogenase (short-subunit alcohol dehydrogenase family)
MAAMDLKDRVALVAGGTGVLGIAIARALARAGADVGITYLERRDAARETCAAVEALGRRAFSVALDQTDAGAIPGAIEAAARHFGRLDALVNNAAWNIAIPFPDLESLDAATWDRLFSTNLRGPYLLCRAAAPRLKAGGAGRIVNIASVAGLNPGGSSIAYATSKAGLIHLTRCLAVALAPEVTVNCVAPGLMEGTRMTSRLRPETAEGARQRAALKRAASVEDVADQVVTFCRSDSVTGQVLNIDAGVFFH